METFYVYKELIQIFEELFDDSYTRNYYRGQAHDWQMKAGLFRNDVIDDFKKNLNPYMKILLINIQKLYNMWTLIIKKS